MIVKEKIWDEKDPDTVWFEDENDVLTLLANFRPEIQEEIQEISLDKTRYMIRLGIIQKGAMIGETECSVDDWGRPGFYYRKFGVSSGTIWIKSKAEEKVKEIILMNRGDIPVRKKFLYRGKSLDGAMFVSEYLGVIEQASLPEITQREADYLKHSLFGILPDARMIILFAVSLLAPIMSSLIGVGRKTPAFITFIQAETGARKTTISSLVYCYNAEGKATMSFESTFAGIDQKMKGFRDHVLLLDDMHPATTPTEKSEQRTKAELLVRTAGDSGSTRQKMHGSAVTSNRTECLAVVTGESLPEFSASSDARVLKIQFTKEEVDLKALTAAQTEIEVYQELHRKWINLILMEKDMPENIYKEADRYNKEYQIQFPDLHPRVCAIYGWICAVFECFAQFCGRSKECPDRLEKEVAQLSDYIHEALAEAERKEKELNGPQKYFSLLMELKELGQVSFVRIREKSTGTLAGKAEKAVLFYDADYVYLRTDLMLQQIRKNYPECEISSNKFRLMLESDGCLRRREGNLTTGKQINGKRFRVSSIDRKMLEKLYGFSMEG